MLEFLVTLLVLLAVLAVVAYVLQTYIVVDPHLRNLITLLLGVILLVWLIMALAGSAPLFPLRRGP